MEKQIRRCGVVLTALLILVSAISIIPTYAADKPIGIDGSHYQGTINWESASKSIDFAIIRCGIGDNIVSQDDRQWHRTVSECERLGIPYGVYLYSYAETDDQA